MSYEVKVARVSNNTCVEKKTHNSKFASKDLAVKEMLRRVCEAITCKIQSNESITCSIYDDNATIKIDDSLSINLNVVEG